jgi:hypothetical protein
LATRRKRRQYVLDALAGCVSVSPVPHHDADAAVGVAIRCSTAEQAQRLQEVRGVVRLFDTGRHVHTNWEPVLVRRSHHPAIDPYTWAYGSADAAPAVDCPNAIDILQRTCGITVDPEIPGPVFRRMIGRIVDAVAGIEGGSPREEGARTADPSSAGASPNAQSATS